MTKTAQGQTAEPAVRADQIDFSQLFTVPDAADALGMSVQRLYALIRAGKIPSVKLSERQTRVPMNVIRAKLAQQLAAAQG